MTHLLWILLVCLTALCGCASKGGPQGVVDTVCFSTQGLDEPAARLARKAALGYVAKYGMRLVENGCDARVHLLHLRTAASSERSLLFGLLASPTNYAALDGTTTVVVRGVTVAADAAVTSSKYTAISDAIDSFVWQSLKPLFSAYRATKTP